MKALNKEIHGQIECQDMLTKPKRGIKNFRF